MPRSCERTQDHAPRLGNRDGGRRVAAEIQPLDARLDRPILVEDPLEGPAERQEPLADGGPRAGLDHTVRHVGETVSVRVDDAVARRRETGIDTEDPIHSSSAKPLGISRFDDTFWTSS
jgi:hypothetical protein